VVAQGLEHGDEVFVLFVVQDDVVGEQATIAVDTLMRDPAILLLTEGVAGAGALAWLDWGRIAEWVGDLPIAFDLFNRSLALNAISPGELLRRVDSPAEPASAAAELDRLREALRGEVPKDAVRGVTDWETVEWALQQTAELFWGQPRETKNGAQGTAIQGPVVRHNHLAKRVLAAQDDVAS